MTLRVVKKTIEAQDIAARLCNLPLVPQAGEDAIPMYSFARPARMLWQTVFERLIERGWSEEDAIAFLQSKGARHALDGVAGQMIEGVGKFIAANADKSYIR